MKKRTSIDLKTIRDVDRREKNDKRPRRRRDYFVRDMTIGVGRDSGKGL